MLSGMLQCTDMCGGRTEGLYTEMDFRNEGLNMLKMQEVLDGSEFFDSSEIVIPKPFMPLSSRSVDAPGCLLHAPMLLCRRCAYLGLARLNLVSFAACSLMLLGSCTPGLVGL